jgi:tRNA modification GTPase
MNTENDTIAAIATAPGAAGIAIVRVSGPDALSIADRIFRCPGPRPSARPAGSFVYGHVHTDHDLDEAILLIYRAPASYTREDVIELQGHGGTASARRLLRAALSNGARLADPGEFTRRAFLSGRIDLLQAEAVMDLISAQSERAAAAALEQLEGSLSSAFNQLYDRLIEIASELENRLDFEEDELPARTLDSLRAKLDIQREALRLLARTWEEGHLLREGALVVIAGKPNVGKSTLMNTLLNKPRAIVTDIPGTTRDTLEEQLVLNGFPIRLVDTAGIRDADCGIEQEGIRRARSLIGLSDLTLLLLDGSEYLNDQDMALISSQDPRKTLLVINKKDKGQKLEKKDIASFRHVSCSLLTGEGLSELKTALSEALHLDTASASPPRAVISERHFAVIQTTTERLDHAASILAGAGDSFETLASSEIRESIEQIGNITGRTYHSELLDMIFSRFCIGK